MEYRKLGNTDINVSLICLGTMTWGQQNSEEEAHQQMDYAFEKGINFFDTAELYPIPPMAETQGRTESYIGSWFKKTSNRQKVFLASKVAGRTTMDWFREGKHQLDQKCISSALENSLLRLQTDYIDLYQLHWPDRPISLFGAGGAGYRHYNFEDSIPPEETLKVLSKLVEEGKIRYIGLSNETPWGLSSFLQAAEDFNLPKVVSVQNIYNLLSRVYEIGLSEFSYRDQISLLAYSPLAQGYLTGKYLDGARPEGARTTLFNRGQRYETPHAEKIIKKYMQLANEYHLDPALMALAFVNQQEFVTSNIIGATNMDQLEVAIKSFSTTLSKELIEKINLIHLECPNPCP